MHLQSPSPFCDSVCAVSNVSETIIIIAIEVVVAALRCAFGPPSLPPPLPSSSLVPFVYSFVCEIAILIALLDADMFCTSNAPA